MTQLTLDRLKELYSYNPMTGVFTRLHARNNTKPGPLKTKENGDGYLRIYIDGVRYRQHRLAVFYMTGEWPKQNVDHKFGDRSLNAAEGLRDVSNQANCQNQRRAHCDSGTGILGVSIKRRKDGTVSRYQAQITADYKNIWLGLFKTKEEAHAAYVSAKRQLHAGNTL